MKTRPILFSGPMVNALLQGRKTQTRRLLKIPAPFDPLDDISVQVAVGEITAPYAVGDLLWVRETHGFDVRLDLPSGQKVKYRATNGLAVIPESGWKPSIHMPRWASRLTLRVTDVRVQRLQKISEADAIAEGVSLSPNRETYYRVELPKPNKFGADMVDSRRAATCFRTLWDSLNADSAPWADNPWIVAYTFEVHACNVDQMPVEA